MLATLVHGMVDSSLFLPELAATFWVIIALTVMLATSPRVIPSEARNLKTVVHAASREARSYAVRMSLIQVRNELEVIGNAKRHSACQM